MTAAFILIAALGADAIPKEFVHEAGGLKRFIQLQPVFRTKRIVNVKTNDELTFADDSPEFAVLTTDGRRFTTDDFAAKAFVHGRVTLQHRADERMKIVVDSPDALGKSLDRQLTLEGFGDVERLDVEAMKIVVRPEIGGLGQPLFLDDRWFVGLEHPAGTNRFDLASGCVLLSQHPSKPESMVAVVGGLQSREDRLEDAFERHLDSIRRQTPRPLLQYNTWYDLRGVNLNPGNAKRAALEIDRRLLTPFNLNLHSVVIDDGWQEPQSLWEPNETWKSGFDEMFKALGGRRGRLGLWLPLNGASLDASWGEAKGYPKTNHRKDCYCLNPSHYQSAMREVLSKKEQQDFIGFYKHDFNYLTCSLPGHGHLPTPEHGREANVNGQLEILRRHRVSSAVTSNAWPSPYWLKHTDFLWIGSYDYAEDWSVPCWSKRQAEMTFRDSVIHRLLRIDRAQVPMNALMTHGLIRGRLEGADADRDLNDWADYVMMFLGRGVMLQELYLTPDLLGKDEWEILGTTLKWADSRKDTLKHTRMIGGSPSAGEPYGYIHWSEDMGIVCLRNPSPRPTEIVVTLDERPRQLGSHPVWEGLQVYPDRRRRAAITTNKGSRVKLNGHEVAVVEFVPAKSEKIGSEPIEHSSPISVLRNEPDRLDWDFEAAVGEYADAELLWWTVPADGAVCSIKADSRVRSPATQSDATWSMHRATFHSQDLVSIRLPFSPFWPQQPKVSALLRTVKKRSVSALRENASNLDVEAPQRERLPEIRPSHRDHVITETLVLDDWLFHRRRSWPEKLGWVLALGVAPIAILSGAGRKVGVKFNHPKLAALLAVVALVCLYTLTPVGAALGRVLGEF